MAGKPFIHPYIPNAAPATKQAMLDELGLSSVEDIYAEIPERLRFKGTLDIPPAILAERDLRRHVQGLLDQNTSCVDFLNFCGAGCWQHHVPSIVDEVINRAEFVSAYCGGDYSDLGKYLTRFEFNSMLGELLDYDAVANPIYDWGDVAGRSFRMARRITGRDKVLVPSHMSPMRLMEARTLCQPEAMANSTKIRFYEWDRETGMVDLDDLRAKLDDSYAAVYWESPGYLGTIEANGAEIVKIAHEHGALAIAGVDPITLGVLAPPGALGADVACGDIQGLGMHMHAGGGCSGFIAFKDDDPVFAQECPLELYTVTETATPGQYAVGEALAELLQGVRRRLRRYGQNGGRDQQEAARPPDLRRQGPLGRVPRARPERALLRHRVLRPGRHRDLGRGRQGCDGMSETPHEKVARLAKLRRDGGVLRDYQAPRWDEPFIMEQGAPGERGILVPLAEDDVTAAVGEAASYIPAGMSRAAAPELPEMAQYQVLRHYLRYSQMTLGMDLGSDISEGTCTMKYSPKMH